MSLSVGDKVSLIHSTEKGKILRFEGDVVIVETTDGFEIPVLANELVSVEQQLKPKVVFTADPIEKSNSSLAENFYLALGRQDIRFACSIINKTEQECLTLFQVEQGGELKTIFAGKMRAGEVLRKIALVEPSESKVRLILKTILYSDQSLDSGQMLNKTLTIKGKHLEGAQHVPELGDDALLFPLKSEHSNLDLNPSEIEEALQTPEKIQIEEIARKPMEPLETPVIDLHLEALPEKDRFEQDQSGLLEYQILVFQQEMDKAISKGLREITFIHGAGNGTLKSELQKLISKNEHVDTFKDALRERFGYGALKVLIK